MAANSTLKANPVPKSKPQRRFLTRKGEQNMAFYIFIAPWLLGFITLVLLPLIGGLILSFTNYDGLNWSPLGDSALNTIKFKGFDNYTRIFEDADAMWSLRRVFIWTGLNTPLWLIISFVIAYLLHQRIRGRGIFRTIFYLPSIIPIVAIATIGSQLFHQRFGLINQFMDIFIDGFSVNWLIDYAMISITSMAVWTGIGNGMIIFLAGFQGIPDSLEEAAIVDGANRWQRFWRITVPLMTPLIFYQLLLSLVTALQYVSLPLLMAPSGSNAGVLSAAPQRNVYLFMIHAFVQGFGRQRLGYSLALTWFLVIIIVVFTVILFRTAPLWVHYENED